MAGYHLQNIKKGKLGTVSKIQEEYDEAVDSINQKVKIMLLVEFSDLIGAVKLVAQNCGSSIEEVIKDLPTKEVQASMVSLQKMITQAQESEISKNREKLLSDLKLVVATTVSLSANYGCDLEDLLSMQKVTERAFKSGARQ